MPTPSQQRGRRRRRGDARICDHCGRTFKRNEHLQRHVRTHTKEKPYLCSCGAGFTRRDLLTRHQRITSHQTPTDAEPGSPSAEAAEACDHLVHDGQHAVRVESDFAAAASLSSLSGANLPDHAQYPTINSQTQDLNDLAPSYQQPYIAPELLNDNQAISGFDHFREFASFLEGVGLPAEWSPYFSCPHAQRDDETEAQQPRAPDLNVTSGQESRQESRLGTPFSCWLPSAPSAPETRITSCPQDTGPGKSSSQEKFGKFRIDDEQHRRLVACLEEFRHVIDSGFKLPSRHALTRYVTSFFEGFHSHLIFIHVPTWRISETPFETILAIATVGAQYCFEHRIAEQLFFAGKAVMMERLAYKAEEIGLKTYIFLGLNSNANNQDPPWATADSYTGSVPWNAVDTIQALIILMGFATWEPKESLLREAFALQPLLAQVCRDVGLEEPPGADQPNVPSVPQELEASWLAWARQEVIRRSKLIAFSFIHIHSVAYNVYPVLRSNEIHLRLPCSTKEWRATTAAQWASAQSETRKQQLKFQDALSLLLRNVNGAGPLDPIPTPLGNYVLLHGLLQRILIVRDLSLPVMDGGASLPGQEVEKLERALRSWTSGWQQAPESSLDPNNENGPIPFTSSSLLALAYARIYLDLGPYRALETRDTSKMAKALMKSPAVARSSGVISALLYAAHALSIPVRLGVDRVARSQAFFWSVRHSLSGLECAVLLSKWLCLLDSSGLDTLSDSEERILHWVRCVVQEAWAVVDFADCHDARLLGPDSAASPSPRSLGFAVLQIWGHFFKSNTQWPFINIIGESLEKYRAMLVSGHAAPMGPAS